MYRIPSDRPVEDIANDLPKPRWKPKMPGRRGQAAIALFLVGAAWIVGCIPYCGVVKTLQTAGFVLAVIITTIVVIVGAAFLIEGDR